MVRITQQSNAKVTCARHARSDWRRTRRRLLFPGSSLDAVGKRVIGVLGGGGRSGQLIPSLVELYKQGRFPFDRLVKYYEFDQIEQALEDSRTGKVTPEAVMCMSASPHPDSASSISCTLNGASLASTTSARIFIASSPVQRYSNIAHATIPALGGVASSKVAPSRAIRLWVSNCAPWSPNAAAQARQTAGARDERTLFAVACSRLLGAASSTHG